MIIMAQKINRIRLDKFIELGQSYNETIIYFLISLLYIQTIVFCNTFLARKKFEHSVFWYTTALP